LAEVGDLYISQVQADAFSDGFSTCDSGYVLQHTLTLVSDAGRTDGRHSQRSAQLAYNESSEGFAPNVIRDDQKRLATLCNLRKEREQVLLGADLAFVNKNVYVVESNFHAFGVGDEMRGEGGGLSQAGVMLRDDRWSVGVLNVGRFCCFRLR
jgi:hypothetical protein